MASEASGPPVTTASTPARPLADARSWRSLVIVGAIALFTTLNWPTLAWVWGAIVLLLFLRAGMLVLAARGASADPEEAHQKSRLAAAADKTR